MNNMYMLSTSIAFVYFLIRFVEIRMGKKENIPFKQIIKDTIVVFIACLLGGFMLGQLSPYMNETVSTNVGGGKSPVFTDNPNF